jgi:hypothetical protein
MFVELESMNCGWCNQNSGEVRVVNRRHLSGKKYSEQIKRATKLRTIKLTFAALLQHLHGENAAARVAASENQRALALRALPYGGNDACSRNSHPHPKNFLNNLEIVRTLCVPVDETHF